MKKRDIRFLSIISLILGTFFLLNSKTNITGAVIDSSGISSTFSLVLGIILIIISAIIFSSTETLERKLENEPKPTKEDYPIIIDTNYLIDACRDRDSYDHLVELIKARRDKGNSIYIPSEVLKELDPTKARNERQKTLQSQLKRIIKEQTLRLEVDRPKYNESGKESKYDPSKVFSYTKNRKIRYENMARSLLEKTPKNITSLYLNELDKGVKISVRSFIEKNKSKLDGSYSLSDYEAALNKGRREYEREIDKRKLIHRYEVSKGDVEILANSFYIQNIPNRYGNHDLDKVTILSADEHLLQVEKIFDNKFKKRKGKIVVKPEYN
ncbi:hypothetical protein J4423_04490 [Candidatus Pacearchaeota archaeon]|nr:hypothetical protein [Candidatus Pacearchaeota archaeon]